MSQMQSVVFKFWPLVKMSTRVHATDFLPPRCPQFSVLLFSSLRHSRSSRSSITSRQHFHPRRFCLIPELPLVPETLSEVICRPRFPISPNQKFTITTTKIFTCNNASPLSHVEDVQRLCIQGGQLWTVTIFPVYNLKSLAPIITIVTTART